MVRNSFGGNRAKKQARKNTSTGSSYANNKLRLPSEEEPDEIFAVVTKIYGHGQVEVKCIDSKKRGVTPLKPPPGGLIQLGYRCECLLIFA